MVERAEPGDALSVGVALDYVMDGCNCERGAAKSELYRHAARLITGACEDHGEQSVASYLSILLFDGAVDRAVDFVTRYGAVNTKWDDRVAAWLDLCSWVEGVD